MDEGGVIDCIYCNFKNAFDKVPHRRLINNNTWLDNSIPKQQNPASHSEWRIIRVQKSNKWYSTRQCLRPTTVCYLYKCLPEQVNSECYLFADDTKIFREIKGLDDHTILQNEINTMLE